MRPKKHKRESKRRFIFSNNLQPKRRASAAKRRIRKAKGAAKYRRNQHHIFCQQRFPEFRHESRNIVDIKVIPHDRYHWLFQNRTPEEIVDYLVYYFWGGYVPATIKMRNLTHEQITDYVNNYFGVEREPSAIQLCALGASEAAG